MKQLRQLLCTIACMVGLSIPISAQLTTITATSIKMAGSPVASGTVTFIPTNSTGQPLSVTAGGSLYDAQGFTASISNGSLSGTLNVPDACTSSPTVANTHMYYQVTVYNSSTKKSFTLSRVDGVCGPMWALDGYIPTQSAVVLPTGLVSGVTVPTKCTGTSLFYTQTATSLTYNCVGGVYVLQSGSGGAGATGPQGPKGDTGATGPQGPKGDTGATGPAGTAATITVGTVTTGAPGTNATVTNSGSSSAAVFNFTIPQGATGSGSGGSASVMGASGPSHAAGLVPDPGATAGTAKVLHENGIWDTPFNDTTKNTSIVYNVGSNGDASCPAPTMGQDITCYFAAVNANKRSINGSAYQLIPTPVLTSKGDLMVFDTAPSRLPVGTNGQYLTPDSTQPTGMKWADLPSGSGSSGGAGIILKFQSSSAAITANNEYVYGDLPYPLIDTNGANSMIVPKGCTVKRITYSFFAPFGMPSPSGLNVTYTLSDQGSGTTLLTTTATDWAGAFHPVVDDVSGLSISLTAGQKIQLKLTTPAWTTNPNTPVFSASVYCE